MPEFIFPKCPYWQQECLQDECVGYEHKEYTIWDREPELEGTCVEGVYIKKVEPDTLPQMLHDKELLKGFKVTKVSWFCNVMNHSIPVRIVNA